VGEEEFPREFFEDLWTVFELAVFRHAFNRGRSVVLGALSERPDKIDVEVSGPIDPKSGLPCIYIDDLHPENVVKAYAWLKRGAEYLLKRVEEVWGAYVKKLKEMGEI